MLFSNAGYRYSINLYLRGLGIIYLIALYSCWTQIHGLIGEQGILPVTAFLNPDASALTLDRVLAFPTLLWWFSTDLALSLFCIIGMIVSVLLIAGFLPVACTTVLWTIYLSLSVGGQIFFSYQWDAMLLECGLLAILVAPPVLWSRPSVNPEPSRIIIFLIYWLLFRFMFSSGFMKLVGGDPSWRDLTALSYHLWTQPLPTWTAWYYHQLPMWALKFSVGAMLVIEVVVPFLVFTSRILRTLAFGLFVSLQVIIGLTGNFGFFNLLSIVMCLPLLDDRWFEGEETMTPELPSSRVQFAETLIHIPAVIMIMTVSIVYFVSMIQPTFAWPPAISNLVETAAPFRSVNQYGLFTHMTKERPEIIIEGSSDGREWRRYTFAYKPGDEDRTPRVVAPHMPRLDWQMWFAALGHYTGNKWLLQFMQRLTEGSPDVLALLEDNPFGADPPRYVRAVLYNYTFASREDHEARNFWWKRELKGLYCPVVTRNP